MTIQKINDISFFIFVLFFVLFFLEDSFAGNDDDTLLSSICNYYGWVSLVYGLGGLL